MTMSARHKRPEHRAGFRRAGALALAGLVTLAAPLAMRWQGKAS